MFHIPSLTRFEQHRARRTDTHELEMFCARDNFICHSIGLLLHTEQYLPDQRVLMRVSRLHRVWLTPVHLHGSHHSCSRVYVPAIFINLYNQIRVLPLGLA